MEHFPAPLDRAQSDAMADRIEALIHRQGWGFWAAEWLEGQDGAGTSNGMFMGFIGLNRPTAPLPFAPCVEIGWRLARPFWGRGLATEGARLALRAGFDALGLEEIVAFTARRNRRSRAVMERLGMRESPSEAFDHPSVPEGHAVRPHVLYRLTRTAWCASPANCLNTIVGRASPSRPPCSGFPRKPPPWPDFHPQGHNGACDASPLSALLLAAALAAAAAWTLGSRRAAPPAPASPPLAAVESLGDLVSVRVRYANVIEFHRTMTQGIPWTRWELPIGETRVLLVARGDCLVGTDLRAARAAHGLCPREPRLARRGWLVLLCAARQRPGAAGARIGAPHPGDRGRAAHRAAGCRADLRHARDLAGSSDEHRGRAETAAVGLRLERGGALAVTATRARAAGPEYAIRQASVLPLRSHPTHDPVPPCSTC